MRSLRSKIGLSYFVLVAITVVMGVFAAVQFTRLSRTLGQIVRENYRSVLAAENMVKALDRQEGAQLAMQSGDLQAGRAMFIENRNEFFKWYEEGIRGIALPEEPILLDSISATYDAYLNASDSLASLIPVASPDSVSRFRQAHVQPLAARVRNHNLALLDVNQNAIMATRERVEQAGATAAKGVIAASIVAVVLSLLAVGRFAQQILGPIGNLTNLVRRIGRGQLNEKIDISSDDELAELEREFNKMTERLQAFDALNIQQLIAEKKKTESLVQTIPNPVIVTDKDHRLLLLNRAAVDLLGVSDSDSWRDRPLSQFASDSRLRGLALDQEEEETGTIYAIRIGDSVRHFRRQHVPVRSATGEVELHIHMLEDVTHFRELDQLKSDFLAAVSHELRTPLTSVGMAIDIMLQLIPGPITATQRDLLETMQGDSERLKKLVNVLLSLARLESGIYSPAREAVYLKPVVDEALAPLQLPFREKGIELRSEVDDDLPPVLGDADHLSWVISNLASNALRHTEEGGLVRIAIREEESEIHITVSDTGTGIPQHALETIFDKFVQLKGSNESTPGSVGLGLALARRVVDAHGGRIWAESEINRGSVFHVVLPCADVLIEHTHGE